MKNPIENILPCSSTKFGSIADGIYSIPNNQSSLGEVKYATILGSFIYS